MINGNILTGPMEIVSGFIDGIGAVNSPFHNGTHSIDGSALQVSASPAILDEYDKYIRQKNNHPARRVSTSCLLEANDEAFLRDDSIIFIDGNLEIDGLTYKSRGRSSTIIVDGRVVIKGDSRVEGLIEIIAEKSIVQA